MGLRFLTEHPETSKKYSCKVGIDECILLCMVNKRILMMMMASVLINEYMWNCPTLFSKCDFQCNICMNSLQCICVHGFLFDCFSMSSIVLMWVNVYACYLLLLVPSLYKQ